MALLPTLLAIGIGVGLGMYWGGNVTNLIGWRPGAWQLLAGGVSVLIIVDLLPVGGPITTFFALAGAGAVLAFAVLNVRIGGMVLVIAGLGLNLLVAVINWGTPVSGSALVSAGIVTPDDLPALALNGGRVPADGALLGFLGDVIPLPWGQVVSVGDLLLLVGIALVTASIARRYQVGGHGGGHGTSSVGRGAQDYRSALDALGRGPAPRHGPGLHPSRLPKGRTSQRRRPGPAPR